MTRTCCECGKPMPTTKRSHAMTCSHACRTRRWRFAQARWRQAVTLRPQEAPGRAAGSSRPRHTGQGGIAAPGLGVDAVGAIR